MTPATRIKVVDILYSIYGQKALVDFKCPFVDVTPLHLDGIRWALSAGIVKGVSPKHFDSFREITKQELCTIMLRLNDIHDFDYKQSEELYTNIPFYAVDDDVLTVGDIYSAIVANGFPYDEVKPVPFPNRVRVYPKSADDYKQYVNAAMDVLARGITIDYRDLSELDKKQIEDELLTDAGRVAMHQYDDEVWYQPKLRYDSALEPVIKDGGIDIYSWYTEAHVLVCDLDPFLTAYADKDLSTWADSVYKSVIQPESSQVDKVVAAVDWLCQNTSYDKVTLGVYEKSNSFLYAKKSHSILGIKESGIAVCDGYNSMFCYLMERAGIPCITVVGSTKSQEMADANNYSHAWAKVKIDNNWYNVDTSWADTWSKDLYVLKSDATMISNHHYPCIYNNGAYTALDDFV